MLASMGTDSKLESTVTALRLKDTEDLTWEAITADLIQEYKRIKSSNAGLTQGMSGGGKHKGKSHRRKRAAWQRILMEGQPGKVGKGLWILWKEGSYSRRVLHQSRFIVVQIFRTSQEVAERFEGDQEEGVSRREAALRIHCYRNQGLRFRSCEVGGKKKAYLDSEASVSMFKRKKDVDHDSYKPGSDSYIRIAVGGEKVQCLSIGTLKMGKIEVPDAMHVKGLNDTLVSVGQVCDGGHIVVFTKKEAVILDTTKFSVHPSQVAKLRDSTVRVQRRSGSGQGRQEVAGCSE